MEANMYQNGKEDKGPSRWEGGKSFNSNVYWKFGMGGKTGEQKLVAEILVLLLYSLDVFEFPSFQLHCPLGE